MKIEFLAEGAPECPLIRLFAFAPDHVERLRRACGSLADGEARVIALHEQPWVHPVGGCRLEFHIAPSDVGITTPAPGAPFVLALSAEGWRQVDDKLVPFVAAASGFNWLSSDGDVTLLISHGGYW